MSEEEFEKQTLDNLITDLKDIDKYTSFKNGAFIYDLGKYQGTLLVNHIEHLQQENKQLKEQLENDIDRYEDTISYQLGFDKGKEYMQQKIDKAIEYIKENNLYLDFNMDYEELANDKLLELLGDKENDEL